MLKILNLETQVVEDWTIEAAITEINRDRSEEWQDYDETDWREGWQEWVEGEFYSLIETAAPIET